MKKQISFSNENMGIEPYLKTKDLKELYEKIAGYSYEER